MRASHSAHEKFPGIKKDVPLHVFLIALISEDMDDDVLSAELMRGGAVHKEVDLHAFDRSAGVFGDGVSVSFDIEFGAEGDDTRVDGDDAGA